MNKYKAARRKRVYPKKKLFNHFKIKDKKKVIVASIVAISLICIGIFLFADRPLSDEQKFELKQTLVYRDGVSIAGIDVSGMTYNQAWAAIEPIKEELFNKTSLELVYEDESWVLTGDKLGFTYNWEKQLEDALFIGYQGSLVKQWSQTSQKTIDFEITYSYTNESVKAAIDIVMEDINREAEEPYASVNDTGSGGKFIYHEGEPGLEADPNVVFNDVIAAINKEDFETPIELDVVTSDPKQTIDDIKEVTKYVAGYTTDMGGSSANRIHNVKKLAGIINGTVIQPGEEFSVNDLAGIRTAEAGWKAAPGIENGTYTDQIGGGVCQVSSTLYNAVLLADLDVTVRQHHSWPSTYVPLGRDATISSYGPDLKFINNQDYPIFIFASATDSKCYVEIYGKPLEYSISLESVLVETVTAPTPKYTEFPDLEEGKEEILSPTKDGLRVKVYKYYYNLDGTLKEKVLDHEDYYRPYQGEIAVGTLETPTPTPTPTVKPTPTKSAKATPTPTDDTSSPEVSP